MVSFIQTLTVSESHTILTASFAFRDQNRPNSHLFIRATNRHWVLINSFKNTFYVPGKMPGLGMELGTQWWRILLTMQEREIMTYNSRGGKHGVWEVKQEGCSYLSGHQSFPEKRCLTGRMSRSCGACVHMHVWELARESREGTFKGTEGSQDVDEKEGQRKQASWDARHYGSFPQPQGPWEMPPTSRHRGKWLLTSYRQNGECLLISKSSKEVRVSGVSEYARGGGSWVNPRFVPISNCVLDLFLSSIHSDKISTVIIFYILALLWYANCCCLAPLFLPL
jgi:hypothetical protein